MTIPHWVTALLQQVFGPHVTVPAPHDNSLLTPHPRFGFCTHYLDATMAARLRSAGGGRCRIDANWYAIQPAADVWNWTRLDEDIALAMANGVRPYVTLAYTPGWANGGRPTGAPPADLTQWAAFITAVVTRYPQVVDWGLWNEPNLSEFYSGTFNQYVQLIITGAAAIRAAHAGANVCGPETAYNNDFVWFDKAMAAVGALFDVVTCHWYPAAPNSLTTTLNHAYRVGGRRVWLTEVGDTTCDTWRTLGPTRQAALYQSVFDAAQSRPWLDAVFFYDLLEPATVGCWSPPATPALSVFQTHVR